MKKAPDMITDPRAFLETLFGAAVAAADPMAVMAAHLPPRPKGRVLVIGAGKASARMAEAVEAAWGPCAGLVVTRYGYGRPTRGIEIVEAGHPTPDAAGHAATRRMLDLVGGLGADDLVLVLISGGGSALLVAPVEGVSLADKIAFTQDLLACGAPIDVMNRLRKRLSRVKGGQLAAACAPAQVVSLIISDVAGDDPAVIASGPTVGHEEDGGDIAAVLARFDLTPAPAITRALAAPSPIVLRGDPRLASCHHQIIAAPAQSLEAAARIARDAGCEVRILGDALEGEARLLAAQQAAMARDLRATARAQARPIVILSGGECTVTKRGSGIGGPNAEFTLAAMIALNGAAGIYAMACDTDGVDGAAEVAGAFAAPDSLARARACGQDPARALAENDAHRFFGALGDQVVTGPTLTNVNDFRAFLILPEG